MTEISLTRLRQISIPRLIEESVDWIAKIVQREEAPGVIVGLSGTDSLLTYIFCLKAFEKLGLSSLNVRGVNFQHQTQDKFVEMNAPFVCTESEDTRWVEREIFPWIKDLYPTARLEVDTSILNSKDGSRWGALHDKAKEEVNGRGDMLTGTYYFPIGTRNATEELLGAYTLITHAVSMLPIKNLFKTEVIDICRYLGVPDIAIEKSNEIDCDCGRFEIQAHHMLELDTYLMTNQGLVAPTFWDTVDSTLKQDVECFFREERLLNNFKRRTPYLPPYPRKLTSFK